MSTAQNRKGRATNAPIAVAVDTGGTFTDVIAMIAGELHTLKVPSTPADPAQAVLAGVRALLERADQSAAAFVLLHGSTVATNALLERKGATVALVTNRGFEDVLEIGRQNRPQLYALTGWRKPPLVPAERRLGVSGRLGPNGEELEALDDAELNALAAQLGNADAIAVCLLHAYANGEPEQRIRDALGSDAFVSLSHEVLAEYREFERCSTTVVNAYVAPVMNRYLGVLERSDATRVRIMGSGGGTLPVRAAREYPIHTVLSGPAGGVVGALAVGSRAGYGRIVTFDMGGTSTDVSLCPERILHTRAFTVDGMPIAIPVMDIHTVGAGGGSIAWLDAGGALRVGPQSAGARPGPICYGRGGTDVTVTDAQVWLNRLPANAFLGGTAELDRASIEAPLRALARSMDSSLETTAEGIIEVVNTSMEGALRVITVERGFDPVDFTLVSFGGAAGLHAVELAERLGIPRILLPQNPGLLSAYGMLLSPTRRDAARTVLLPASSANQKRIAAIFKDLEADVSAAMREEGIARSELRITREVDARYQGQSFELRVPAENWTSAFHAAHEQRYGYRVAGATVEAVTLRVTGESATSPLPSRRRPTRTSRPRPASTSSVLWRGRRTESPIFARVGLAAGAQFKGPAVITEYSSTAWLPPGWRCTVDAYGNLIIEAQ